MGSGSMPPASQASVVPTTTALCCCLFVVFFARALYWPFLFSHFIVASELPCFSPTLCAYLALTHGFAIPVLWHLHAVNACARLSCFIFLFFFLFGHALFVPIRLIPPSTNTKETV